MEKDLKLLCKIIVGTTLQIGVGSLILGIAIGAGGVLLYQWVKSQIPSWIPITEPKLTTPAGKYVVTAF